MAVLGEGIALSKYTNSSQYPYTQDLYEKTTKILAEISIYNLQC